MNFQQGSIPMLTHCSCFKSQNHSITQEILDRALEAMSVGFVTFHFSEEELKPVSNRITAQWFLESRFHFWHNGQKHTAFFLHVCGVNRHVYVSLSVCAHVCIHVEIRG